MNHAATPVHQLDADQAVEELARILDSAPDESDQLAMIHWRTANTTRAQQLEQHILHLAKMAGADALPGPVPESQDAPPHHLQPEKETTVNPNQEKVQEALIELLTVTDQANAAPDRATFKTLHTRAGNLRFKIRDKCRKHGITEPEMPDPPVNPFLIAPEAAPMPTGSEPAAHALVITEENEERAQTLQMLENLSPKAGPGPYVDLTAEALRSMLPDPFLQRSACADDCIHPDHHHSTADLDWRDSQPQLPRVTVAPSGAIREIRKALWGLLRDMEDMTYAERAALSRDLVFIQHQAAHGLDLIEETEIPEAG